MTGQTRLCALRLSKASFTSTLAVATVAGLAAFFPARTSHAADHTWTGAVSSQWTLPGNWLGSLPPPNDGTGVCHFLETSGTHTVTLPTGTPWSVLGLAFASGTTYTLSPGGGTVVVGARGIVVEDPASGSSANHTFFCLTRPTAHQVWRNRTAARLSVHGIDMNGQTVTLEGGPGAGDFRVNLPGPIGVGALVVRNLDPLTVVNEIQDQTGINISVILDGTDARVRCLDQNSLPPGTVYLREGMLDLPQSQRIGIGGQVPSLVLGGTAGCPSTSPAQRVVTNPASPGEIRAAAGNAIEYRAPAYGYASIEGAVNLGTFGSPSFGTIYVEAGADPVNDLVISAVLGNGGATPGPNPYLRKSGDGELRLLGANTFSRRFEVAQGKVTLENDLALGAAGDTNRTVVLSGATVEVSPGLSVAETIHLGTAGATAPGTLRGATSSLSGPIRQLGNATLQAFGVGPFAMLGEISTLGSGVLTVDGPGEVSFSGPVNLGLDTVAVAGGSLRLATAASISELDVRNGATLAGDGGTSGRVLVRTGGRAEPGHGALPGAYGVLEAATIALEPGSVTSFAIGGTAPGVTHDQAAVSGSTTLAGTLDLRQGGVFSPAIGDSFVVLTYGSRTGTFDAMASGLTLPPNSQWSLSYGATGLVARVVGLVAVENTTPSSSGLALPTPNPSWGTTTLSFDLARAGRVDLAAFDAAGRRVATIVSGAAYAQGRHSLAWSGRDVEGRVVPQGVYFIQLVLEGAPVGEVRKLVVSL